MLYTLNIRDRRQITLPSEVLDQLQLEVGDQLVLQLDKEKFVAKPLRKQTLEVLETVQKIFEKAEFSESEFQQSGKSIRRALFKEYYGKKI